MTGGAGTFQRLMKLRLLSPVMGPSHTVAGTLWFTVGMVLSAESPMDPQCMSASSTPFSSSTGKMGITTPFKHPL